MATVYAVFTAVVAFLPIAIRRLRRQGRAQSSLYLNDKPRQQIFCRRKLINRLVARQVVHPWLVAQPACSENKRAATKAAPRHSHEYDLLAGLLERVLHIAGGVVQVALCFIELTFCLQFFVARHLASGLFDGAFGLIGGASHVFAIHVLACIAVVDQRGAQPKVS